VRYCKQLEGYSCGPVAILNALKWAGLKKTYKDVKEYKEKCFYDGWEGGVNVNDFSRAFFTYRKHLVIRYRRNFNIGELDKHLETGGAAVVNLRRFDLIDGWKGHFFLVIGKSESGKCFKTVNGYRREGVGAVGWVSRKEFVKHLRSSRIYRPAGGRAWFLKKRPNG